MKSGWIDSAVASATYTVYVPASGGSGAPTPNTGVTATNPVGGTSVTVTSTAGGVVQLQVGTSGGAVPAGNTVTTTCTDATGNVVGTVQGTNPVWQFTTPGIYVAHDNSDGRLGQCCRAARKLRCPSARLKQAKP